MTDALWYLGRGTGVVALMMLTLSLVLGIVNRSRRPAVGLPRFGVTEVHRFASLTATVLVALHVGTLLLDPYAQLRLVDVVLPFVGAAQPFWLGMGTLALDLLAAVVVTGLLRKQLGHRLFKAAHWTSYALWPTAWLHSIGDATDAGSVWFRVFAMATAGRSPRP